MGHSGHLPSTQAGYGGESIRKTGEEPFIGATGSRLTIADFWRWAVSDLVENTTRGLLAEFIVASALGVADRSRAAWDRFDVVAPSGLTIEVKSCAFLQNWKQKRPSRISFSIAPHRAWDPERGEYHVEKRRHADLYVFALLHHRDRETLNPLDLTQWTFYVAPTATIESLLPTAKSVSLAKLTALGATAVDFASLASAVDVIGVPP